MLNAARNEIDRDFAVLKDQSVAAYYLSYEIADSKIDTVSSSFGTLVSSDSSHHRSAHVSVRVGDYALDNTHPVRSIKGKIAAAVAGSPSQVAVPFDDDPLPIRLVLWEETTKCYKGAVTQPAAARTDNGIQIEQEDKSDDFSHEKPEQAIEPIPVDARRSQALGGEDAPLHRAFPSLRRPFQRHGHHSTADQETRWFVSSDGSMIQTSTTYYRLIIEATSKAADGMELPRYESFAALTPAGTSRRRDRAEGRRQDDRRPQGAARRAHRRSLHRPGDSLRPRRRRLLPRGLRPSHRGPRQKSEAEGQTFKKMVGQPVLPTSSRSTSIPR